jgi:hypothetical protein
VTQVQAPASPQALARASSAAPQKGISQSKYAGDRPNRRRSAGKAHFSFPFGTMEGCRAWHRAVCRYGEVLGSLRAFIVGKLVSFVQMHLFSPGHMSLGCIGSGVVHAQLSQHLGASESAAGIFLQREAYRRKLKIARALGFPAWLPLCRRTTCGLETWHFLDTCDVFIERAKHVTVRYWYSHLALHPIHIPFPTPLTPSLSNPFPILLLLLHSTLRM